MSECNNCDKYDYQTHSCPIFCDVIRNTLDDVRADERARMLEKINKFCTEYNNEFKCFGECSECPLGSFKEQMKEVRND